MSDLDKKTTDATSTVPRASPAGKTPQTRPIGGMDEDTERHTLEALAQQDSTTAPPINRALPHGYTGLSYQTGIRAGTGRGLTGWSAFRSRYPVNPGNSEFGEQDLSSGHG